LRRRKVSKRGLDILPERKRKVVKGEKKLVEGRRKWRQERNVNGSIPEGALEQLGPFDAEKKRTP